MEYVTLNNKLGYDFSAFENVEITGIDLDALTDEERSILYVQAKYCQAMDKEIKVDIYIF